MYLMNGKPAGSSGRIRPIESTTVAATEAGRGEGEHAPRAALSRDGISRKVKKFPACVRSFKCYTHTAGDINPPVQRCSDV